MLEQQAPDRSYVHKVKGDILYSQNKKKEAASAYKTAVSKKEGSAQQKAEAYNQYARLQAGQENYQQARELYDQALDLNPYFVEATSNKGVTFEKEGNWSKALESYQQAMKLDNSDTFAAVLAQKAQEMLAVQKNAAERQRIDKLVKDLAERYKSQQTAWPSREDTWTSRPMVLTFVDFQEKGGLSARDGLSMVLTARLSDMLNSSGRVQVVERALIERLLEELNLGSSDLADEETALKLGKVLAAKLIGTGSLFFMPDGTLLNMRLIDSETSAIPKVITKPLGSGTNLEKDLNAMNRDILKTIISKYPLRGFVVQVTGDELMINLGAKQGIVQGASFEIVEEQKPVKYKGKLLQSAPKVIGLVEVTSVEPDLCRAKIIQTDRQIQQDDKVQEKVQDLMAMRSENAAL